MKTHQPPDLSSQIEQLIQDHMATCRRKAQEAVSRAFDAAALPVMTSKTPVAGKPAAATGKQPRRRSGAEMREMSERFYEAVSANPGETMTFLAVKLGVQTLALQRPMALLRQAKRVRSAGQRHHTRYFPMCESDAVEASA
jgi:hypothetical protein